MKIFTVNGQNINITNIEHFANSNDIVYPELLHDMSLLGSLDINGITHTNKFCIKGLCVNKEQLQQILKLIK
jgi:hypothetical protein